MIKILDKKDIEYTHGDTFSLNVYPGDGETFREGMQLRFIISKSNKSDEIINKTVDVNEENIFNLTLTDEDKKKLVIDEQYIYKIVILKNNTVVTRKSGYFLVKWGA